MWERSSRSGMVSPRRLTAIKHPIPPHLRLAISFLLINGPLPHRLARWSRFRCHHQAPSITFFSPPNPPHTRSLVLSFDHPSAPCRIGGLQLTLATMVCLNPSGRRPSTDATPPRSAPSLNSDLPLNHPPTFLPTYIFEDATSAPSILPPCTSLLIHIHNGSSEVRIPSATAMKHGQ